MLDHAKEAVPEARYLAPGHNFGSISDKITGIITGRTPFSWFIGFLIGFSILQLLLVAITYLLFKGTGIWGINNPVGWGFAIINFVWWIGIGHAGTLISAILMLFRQHWRTSINRAAEAMTVFAVACAAIFPIFHTGRPWLAAYWLMPYPNTMGLWPNFRSPLIWDVFAVSTYATVSIIFWYVGLIPDLATMRDRAKSPIAQRLYGIFALGWRGSALHWQRYETASLMLAGLSTPLVLSVHTVVSFDFAVSVIPGWHATIFPPYFVAGAIYAGFAMVLTLLIPMRALYGLHDFITERHIDNMAKVTLATGLIVFYGYCMEAFFGWYSANQFEQFMITNRMQGPYAPYYWALIFCNGVVPQLLWSRKVRTSVLPLFAVCMAVNVGMWLERFVIVVTSLHRDYLPSSWGMFYPTVWDWSTFIGTMGLFLTLFYLFIRVLPMISIFELRTLTPSAHAKGIPTMADLQQAPGLHGVMAEFADATELVAAAKAAYAEGYRQMDAYTAAPVHGLAEALGDDRRVQKFTFTGGVLGFLGGFALCYWTSVIEYPLNIGGRPLNSWVAFSIPTYETTILLAALATAGGMLAINGLPMHYHPVFNVEAFRRTASSTGFFLCIEAIDPRFDPARTRAFLEGLHPKAINEVNA